MKTTRPAPLLLGLPIATIALLSGCMENLGNVSPGVAGAADGGARRAPGAPAAPLCGPPVSQDPRELPPCCVDVGGAHCLRQSDLPPGVTAVFAACPGGVCMPDAFIQTGGQYAPPSCASVGGAAGVCLSTCVPRVRQNADTYPQASCATQERCAPCVEDGAPTGLCPIDYSCPPPPPPPPPPAADPPGAEPGADPPGSDPGGDDVKDAGAPPSRPPASPSTPPASPGGTGRCCGGAGSCVPASGVPAAAAGRLSAEGCGTGEICLPDSLAGGAAPRSCSAAIPFVGSVGGACIPECMVDLGGLGGTVVQQGSCSGGELCVPCEIPFAGPTGLCG